MLKPGGILLLAGAAPDHLFALKRALYDTPYQNEPRADLHANMKLLHTERLAFDMALDGEALGNLFAMTPYFYRTSKEGLERLAALQSLTVNGEFDIYIYQKEAE